MFTEAKRSEIMSKIRSKNTKAELLVFRYLRREGIYFQKHYARAPGKPDIALPRKKIAVFIDGDFWHGRGFNAKKSRLPKKYWVEKIEGNIKRDRRSVRALRNMQWKILRVWESDVARNNERIMVKVALFLRS